LKEGEKRGIETKEFVLLQLPDPSQGPNPQHVLVVVALQWMALLLVFNLNKKIHILLL